MAKSHAPFSIDREKLFALAGPSFSGSGGNSQPNPDEPLKPGPWDPLIRVAIKDVLHFGPRPEPWHFGPLPDPWIRSTARGSLFSLIAHRFPEIWDLLGGGHHFGDEVALNPQPLPPHEALIVALGGALAARAELLADIAGGIEGKGEERGIIIVSGFVSRLVDDWCGTGYRLRWPFPWPRPWWFRTEVSARDTLTLGATLSEAGRQAFDPGVARALDGAASKLAQVGLERMG